MSLINAQNFPRDPKVRRLVIPYSKNEVLLEADLAQAESMIVAWYAKETTLMNKYKNNDDVHRFLASILMERPITKEDKVERTFAKRIVHGSNYGMQPLKIVEVLIKELCIAMEVKKAQRAQNIYFQNFPRIRTGFHLGIQSELRDNNRIIKTPVGFQRRFYAPLGDEVFREAYAFYPQNIVAYITNQALVKLWSWGLGDRVIMQVHDSIVMSVPKTELSTYAEKLKIAMTYPVNIKNEELVIPVDLKWGEDWGNLHEFREES